MTPLNLVDIGANLTHDSFDNDRDVVVGQALEAGVARIILTGSSEQGSIDALALARTRPNVFYATAGVHPHHASEYSDKVHQTLRQLHHQAEVVAVGECGLDYFRNFSPSADQRAAFIRQLELAEDSQLPLFLHQRDAHDDFMQILAPRIKQLGPAVAHCFTGGGEELAHYLELGLSIGITGWICDERRGQHLQEIVGRIPLDKLMIETDAPYLMPRSLIPKPSSRRNEPKYLPEVLRVTAAAMGVTPEVLAHHTTENAERFFGLCSPSD